jgi:hypothetical protein
VERGACLLPADNGAGREAVGGGLATVRTRPFLGDLRWAHGRLPLPDGVLHFAFEATDAGGIRGFVVIPDGYTAIIGGKEYGAGRHEVG